MKITVFSKKITKHDGSKFTGYVTKLKKKDGSEIYCRVRFHEGCRAPRECPAIIAVNKDKANLVKRHYKNDDDKELSWYNIYTLWITDWNPTEEKYVDHSLDDFE